MAIHRRLFLGSILASTCAPAIVRSGVLMPVRPVIVDIWNPANWDPSVAAPLSVAASQQVRSIMEQAFANAELTRLRDVWAGEPHKSKCLGREIRRPDGVWVPFTRFA